MTNSLSQPYKSKDFKILQQTAIKCAYNASRGMIDLLTEAGLEPALLLLLTERLPINGPGHILSQANFLPHSYF